MLFYKVEIEVDGIPAHAWDLDTASKLLAPQCWIERQDEATASKSDMSTFKVSAWTKDPASIPAAKTLLIAEPEKILQNQGSYYFPNLLIARVREDGGHWSTNCDTHRKVNPKTSLTVKY